VKNLNWLASYPKSGNTWFRVILGNLLSSNDKPLDINNLSTGVVHAASRCLIDEFAGIATSELDLQQIVTLRTGVYETLSNTSEENILLKIHDANSMMAVDKSLIPESVTTGVVYLIRNPLDIAVSLAHHEAVSVDRAIDCMLDPEYVFSSNENRLIPQLPQYLSDWSGHVNSWINSEHLSVHTIRYEDMLYNTSESVTKALKFLGLEFTEELLQRAVEFSRFERLQKQEEENGFVEKKPASRSFFRKGEEGDWKNVLSNAQTKRIIKACESAMQQFGYL